jgi:hypothetical protein
MGELKGGQQTGIIVPRKLSVKIHECKTPCTAFKTNGTLWRCSCGKVYVFDKQYNPHVQYTIAVWQDSTIEAWLEAGGSR